MHIMLRWIILPSIIFLRSRPSFKSSWIFMHSTYDHRSWTSLLMVGFIKSLQQSTGANKDHCIYFSTSWETLLEISIFKHSYVHTWKYRYIKCTSCNIKYLSNILIAGITYQALVFFVQWTKYKDYPLL